MNADSGIDIALARLAAAIDRASRVPVSVQLRGALEYGISGGDLPSGARLPSVRVLAAELGLSPVTVSNVYGELRDAGLIESRVGSGSYVADGGRDPRGAEERRGLQERIENLVAFGARLGVTRSELAFRVASADARRRRGLTVLMLGLFPEATEDYAAALRRHLPPGDRVLAATFESVAGSLPPCDLVATPRNMRMEAARLFPGRPGVGLTLIPTEATRVALAGLPSEARICAVSYFPAFLALLRSGVARFAPHVERVEAAVRDDPALDAMLARADVLVFATGADALRERLAPERRAIEYRHEPDPNALRAELLPALEARRAELQRDEDGQGEDRREQLVRDRRLSEA